jgi:hypothetical protein
MSVRQYDPLTIARQYLYVREIPQNRGQRVEAIQKWCGGKAGDSWCCDFATMVLDICYQGQSPLPRTGSCDVALAVARANGWVTTTPIPGDLYFRVRVPDDAHHVGFVCQIVKGDGVVSQISGNTSAKGSDNGDGVYEKDITHTADLVFVHIP